MKETKPSMVFFSRDFLYNAKQNFHGENNNEHQTCVGWLSKAKMAPWCLSLQFLRFITIVLKNKKTCNLDLFLVWMVYHSMGLRNEKGTPHHCLGAKNHLFFVFHHSMDCLLICGEVMEMVFDYGDCRNFNLEFMSKARACKVASQKRSLGVTFHALRSVGECEWMNPHTPKWAPTLGVGVSMDSWIFRERL